MSRSSSGARATTVWRPIALIAERMAAVPETLYGADIASNYQGQGLKLAKHFKAG